MTVAGPETPLAAGIADYFAERGLRLFGPAKEAAKLEASKVFAKRLMEKYGIPTAKSRVFTDPEEALSYLGRAEAPLVVKADGLAAGKGVIVAETLAEAETAVQRIMVNREFGDADSRIIIKNSWQERKLPSGLY